MICSRYFTFTFLLLLAGCSHHVSVARIEVIDTSLSITPRAEHAALDAVGEQISRMGRGDCLILIPITSDAQNDAGGRILRLAAPSEREPYDADLRRFHSEASKQFVAWTASLDSHQMRTDILGALDTARQEIASRPKGTSARLIVVSDFLEDDGTYRFVSAPALATPAPAQTLAATLRDERKFTLAGVSVCLGRLESSDFALLSPRRKEAVQTFWSEYLSDRGQAPELHFDGAGMLTGNSACRNELTDGTVK